MNPDDKERLLKEAKAIAVFGFEQGFKQAIEFVQSLEECANDPQSREIAKLIAASLEKVLPQLLADCADDFTFQIVETPEGGRKISFH